MKFILIPHGIKQRKTVCQMPFFLHYTSERYGSRASCLIGLPLPEWTKIEFLKAQFMNGIKICES